MRALTTADVSRLLQVDRGSVARWADSGRLRCFRTPGGHRRIMTEDVVEFCKQFGFPIPAELGGRALDVLFVDDDPRMKAFVEAFRAAAGASCRCRLVRSGVDALLEVGRAQPDVMVLDLIMPGLDGVEVTRRLRANSQTERIRVIALSGTTDPELLKRARDAGAEHVLEKPIKARDLLQAVVRFDERAASQVSPGPGPHEVVDDEEEEKAARRRKGAR